LSDRDEVSTESGSDRVTINSTVEIGKALSRWLPLPVPTP